MAYPADHYTEIETILASAGVELSASELHGTVVGALANHLKSGLKPDLLKLIEPQAATGEPRFERLSECLYEIYRQVSQQLLESKESYDLLLPGEEESLARRVDALATWSRGYLLGLFYNDAFSIDQLSDSGPEIARDIMQIAEAVAGEDDEKEEDWALAELHEYIKVGTQLIFEIIYAESAAKATG